MLLLAIIASAIHFFYCQINRSHFSNVFFLTAPVFLSFIFLIPVYANSNTYSYSIASYAAYLSIASATSGALVYSHHGRMNVESLYIELKTKAPVELKSLSLMTIGLIFLAVCAYFLQENIYNCIGRCKSIPYVLWVEHRFLKQYIMLFVSVFMNQLVFFRLLAYVFRNRARTGTAAEHPNKNEGA